MPDRDRESVDPEVLAAYDLALKTIAAAGAQVAQIDLPVGIASMAGPLGDIIYAEGYAHYAHLIDDPNAPLDKDVRPRLSAGRGTSSSDYILAKRAQRKIKMDFHAALAGYDALLTPSVATPALFTRVVNMAEMCACSVPTGFSNGGLPLSAQFVAADGQEAAALRAAWGYEQARGFTVGIPEGFK